MAKGFVIDIDTTDDFLDYPELTYRQPDGTVTPLFTEEELSRIGYLYEADTDDAV
jgi:hypothetical protein